MPHTTLLSLVKGDPVLSSENEETSLQVSLTPRKRQTQASLRTLVELHTLGPPPKHPPPNPIRAQSSDSLNGAIASPPDASLNSICRSVLMARMPTREPLMRLGYAMLSKNILPRCPPDDPHAVLSLDHRAASRFQQPNHFRRVPRRYSALPPCNQWIIPRPFAKKETQPAPPIVLSPEDLTTSFFPHQYYGVRLLYLVSDDVQIDNSAIYRGVYVNLDGVVGDGVHYRATRVRQVHKTTMDIELVAFEDDGSYHDETSLCWPPVVIRVPRRTVDSTLRPDFGTLAFLSDFNFDVSPYLSPSIKARLVFRRWACRISSRGYKMFT